MPRKSPSAAPVADTDPVGQDLFSEQVAVVQAALGQRAEVATINRARPDETTPLGWAIRGHRPEVVRALVRAGANLKTPQKRYGREPKCSPLTWPYENARKRRAVSCWKRGPRPMRRR